MSEIEKELNKRVFRCIKSNTGIDLTNPETASGLSLEDRAVLEEFGFKCALRVFRNLARKKFVKWIEEEFRKLEIEATEAGQRIIRFSSKVGDPIDVYNQLTLLTSILENLIEDIDGEELLSDHKAVTRLLIMSYLIELKTRVSINSLRPLLFSIGLANTSLGKDLSWCTSMLALTVEEQFIKKKANEFNIALEKDENYSSVLSKLLKYLETKQIRRSREILLADGHRKLRNKVIHENWNPTEDEMDDIVAHVLKVVQFLDSEKPR